MIPDIIFTIIDNIDNIEDLKNICSTNKQNYQFCKRNLKRISKQLLTNYQVDYTDPTNFIYIYNNKDINDYKSNDQYDYINL